MVHHSHSIVNVLSTIRLPSKFYRNREARPSLIPVFSASKCFRQYSSRNNLTHFVSAFDRGICSDGNLYESNSSDDSCRGKTEDRDKQITSLFNSRREIKLFKDHRAMRDHLTLLMLRRGARRPLLSMLSIIHRSVWLSKLSKNLIFNISLPTALKVSLA
jgi:hypothetical protein